MAVNRLINHLNFLPILHIFWKIQSARIKDSSIIWSLEDFSCSFIKKFLELLGARKLKTSLLKNKQRLRFISSSTSWWKFWPRSLSSIISNLQELAIKSPSSTSVLTYMTLEPLFVVVVVPWWITSTRSSSTDQVLLHLHSLDVWHVKLIWNIRRIKNTAAPPLYNYEIRKLMKTLAMSVLTRSKILLFNNGGVHLHFIIIA